jgi:hypothetical protein
MSERMVFDSLEPKEIPVTLAGKSYVLREASEGAASARQSAISASMKFGPDGNPTGVVGNIGDADAVLLAHCLYEADEDGKIRLLPNGDPDPRYLVPAQKIRGWLSRVTKPLIAKLKEISDLGESEKDTPESIDEKIMRLREQRVKLESEGTPEKNGRVATPTTSA